MIRNCLVVGAAILLLCGLWDLYGTVQSRSAHAIRPQDLAATRPAWLVRVSADPAPAAAAYYELGRGGPRVVALAFEKPVPGKHVVVRLAPCDAQGKAMGTAPWRGGIVTGTLVPVPANLAPVPDSYRFPADCTVSVLTLEHDPQLGYPLVLVIAGAIAIILLLNSTRNPHPLHADRPRVPPPADEHTPFIRVKRSTPKVILFGTLCAAALAVVLEIRLQRLGGPAVFENSWNAIAACMIALASGWYLLERTGSDAVICLGGVELEPGGDIPQFVRWQDVRALKRQGPHHTMVLATELRTIQLELGKGANADRAAAALAAHLRAWLLPVVRERLASGRSVEFGALTLSREELQASEIQGEVLHLKPADISTRYQELENGFLLPALIGASAEGWVAQVDKATAVALASHGIHMLAQAEAAAATDDPITAQRLAERSLTFFEVSGHDQNAACGRACLAVGHAQLGEQPARARETFERATPLLTDDPVDHARAYHGLAVARWQTGDTAGALEAARSAVELLDSINDAPLYHVLAALNTLAGLQLQGGRMPEAKDTMDLLLRKLEEANPGDLPDGVEGDVLGWIQNYSRLCQDIQDAGFTASVHARATGALATLYGLRNALVGQALYALGGSQLAARDAGAAIATLEAALGIARQTHGDNDVAVAACLDRLGEAYWASGHKDKAHSAWKQAAHLANARPA